MGKPSPPKPPDPAATAAAQTGSNVDTARASSQLAAVNQNSPYGSVSYTQSPSSVNVGGQNIPQYTQNVSLSPEQQALYNKTTGIEGQALDTGAAGLSSASKVLSSPFSLQGLPQLPGTNDFSADRTKVENAQLARFNQDFPQLQEDAISRANAEGIQRGSQGYDNVEKNLARQQVDAGNQAILSGGQEQSRLFGLAGQARQQALNEQQLSRNQPINELTALLGTSQIQTPTGAPNFGVQVQPTNTAGIINSGYQNQLGQYQAQLQASPWNALGNIASAGAKAYFAGA